MITRSHYQIRKNRQNWTLKEVKRWRIMKKIPIFKALVAIYNQSMSLYNIYEMRINKKEANKLMKEWIKSNRRYSRVPEILHLADSVERKLDYITNYFVSRHNN
jgi:transposase